jgi:diguanylate cyclase (GGDEF)-like protein
MTIMDGLTQIHNKRYLYEALEREIIRGRRHERDLSILLFDIDHFKRINDVHGHLAGDFVLKELARIVQARIRRDEVFARYGGEEFAIILPKTHLQGALAVAERMFRALRAKTYAHDAGGNGAPRAQVVVTASIGIAFYPSKDVTTPELLVKFADDALYRAKAEGRDTICLYQGQPYRYDIGAR